MLMAGNAVEDIIGNDAGYRYLIEEINTLPNCLADGHREHMCMLLNGIGAGPE